MKFDKTMLKKIIITIICIPTIIIFLCAAASTSTLVSYKYSTQTANESCAYHVSLTVSKSNWKAVKKKETTEKHRYLNIVTQGYQVIGDDGKSKGSVILTWKYSENSGAMVYVDSSVSIPVKLSISATNAKSTPQVHIVKPGDKEINSALQMNKPVTAPLDSSVYIEGKGSYYKLNSVIYTKSLGYTVNEHMQNTNGWQLTQQKNIVTATTSISYKPSYIARASFALSNGPLVNWDDTSVKTKILAIDSKGGRHYFKDGVYTTSPISYSPRNEKDCIYRIAAAHILGIITDDNNMGCFLDLLCQDLMYSHINSYNKEGYIPTQPMSERLMNDYGIGYNFYDTRFNTDTNIALLKAYKKYPDDIILDKLKNAVAFYVNYYKNNNFQVQGNIYLPDYDGDSIKETPNCSLNHYIAEANFLYRYYGIAADPELKTIADSIVDTVDKTSSMWIKPNQDLKYAITTKGEFVGNDYPSVTYNDLIALCKNLEALKMPIGEGIMELLANKEEWMKNNGYAYLMVQHNYTK